jgi:putative integral membrane protein (TIGR02587 family)
MDDGERCRQAHAGFPQGLARAFGGAVVFGLPLLMTMEMWWLAFHMSPARLALLLVLFFPFLVALSWHAGFEPTFSWEDDVVDALVAYAVGFTASAAVLGVLGELRPGMGVQELVGKVSLQAVPASIGALLAQSQFGDTPAGGEIRGGEGGYASELFTMAVGALFLAFNTAPTEEMQMIAARLGPAQAALLAVVTIAVMHAFVYAAGFRGGPRGAERAPGWKPLLLFTVPGYAIALGLSLLLLWTFGRLDGGSLADALQQAAVLGFPAAIGAAAARLIL